MPSNRVRLPCMRSDTERRQARPSACETNEGMEALEMSCLVISNSANPMARLFIIDQSGASGRRVAE